MGWTFQGFEEEDLVRDGGVMGAVRGSGSATLPSRYQSMLHTVVHAGLEPDTLQFSNQVTTDWTTATLAIVSNVKPNVDRQSSLIISSFQSPSG